MSYLYNSLAVILGVTIILYKEIKLYKNMP